METYALLSMCACGICIGLGVGVYFLNRKSTINRLFAVVMLANAYWALCEFMLVRAPTVATAELWNKALSFWAFIVSFALHFTLVFTENNILKRKSSYLLIYLPAVFFALIDLTTNWISSTPVLKPWGYIPSYPSYSLLSSVYGIWSAAITLLTLLLYSQYYYRLTDKTKKEQTRYVAVGFAIPIIMSILTDSIFPVIGIDAPVMGSIATSFTGGFVAYAVVKHDLFGLNLEIAAENVFATMPDSVILVNLEGTIVKVNKAFLGLAKCAEKDVVGKSVKQIIKQANVLTKGHETPQIMAQLRKQRELKNYEIIFNTHVGERKYGSLSCCVVSNNQGQDVGIAIVLHDITEQKELSKKLLDAQRFASIGELAGMVGHDLRNPLTGIKGAAYYLKTKYSATLDRKDSVMFETINKSIDYSNKIINDLVDYSSELQLDLETTTPQKLVQTALAHTPPTQNIQLINEVTETVQLTIDFPKMCRGFINLIKNAYDAMPNGGTLKIETIKTQDKIIFSIADTGEGMTPETLSKIWSPLFTTKAKGMGFGLAICKRCVEAHGGKIWAESQHKKGTTITLELPLDLDSDERSIEKLLDAV